MGLALNDATYNRLCSKTAYIRPTVPGKFRSGTLTGPELATAKQNHEDAITDPLEVNVLERTIINQIQAALDRSILVPKTNKISGLITCSIPDLLAYLFCTFGNISAITLADERYNVTRIQYVHADPIENGFDKINEYANMSEAYGITEPEVQLIEMGLIILSNAVIFADDIGEWNAKPKHTKTWDSFQAHFVAAQTTYKANRPQETSAAHAFTSTPAQANAVTTVPPATEELDAANAYIAELEAAQAATHQANLVKKETLPSNTYSIQQLL